MKIIWRDILKPRYAIVFECVRMPKGLSSEDGWYYTPAVVRLPYKRPLGMGFNSFYNSLSKPSTNVVCGSYMTLRKLYGIGSTNSGNMKNAILLTNDV